MGIRNGILSPTGGVPGPSELKELSVVTDMLGQHIWQFDCRDIGDPSYGKIYPSIDFLPELGPAQ